MQINSCSIEDMNIFRDPSRVPIVLVEESIVGVSNNSVWQSSDQNDAAVSTTPVKHVPKFCLEPKKSVRVLRAVVFVHGFQACLPSHR